VNVPIVITAFGTTTAARQAYSFVDEGVKESLPGYEVHWAFSSRMVRDFSRDRRRLHLKGPVEVLNELAEQGHNWVVVQSLHLLWGHEFYRMVEEVRQVPIHASIGLPLLYSSKDYAQFIHSLCRSLTFPDQKNEAVVFVGHGTDHPSWISYAALQYMLRSRLGPKWFIGVVEGCPSREDTLGEVLRAGIQKVRLVPLMLVSGVHVQEDLLSSADSWHTAFEREGLSVSVEEEGLLLRPGIVEIFIRHIRDALKEIPNSTPNAMGFPETQV
jgi:sirohydrochlorin cobaltochelatase